MSDVASSSKVENVIIVGSGPAGYTAGLYTARANLEPLVIEGFAWGGLLQQTTDVEHYPGFPDRNVGRGPAGSTAGLYTARANLEPLVIEGFAWGGLLQQTTDVENYPGFPEGMMGPELMSKMRAQAERFGARLETDQAERVLLAGGAGGGA